MPDARFEDMDTDITERPETLSPPTDVNALKQSLIEAKARAQEYLEGWQRGQADYVNYKKRIEQEKIDTLKYATPGLY